MAEITHLTDQNYETELKNSPLTLVKYYADWCPPCQASRPIFEAAASGDLATQNPTLTWAEINIDESPTAAGAANVMSIPTLIFYRAGEEIDRHIGGFDDSLLEQFIKSNL